MGGAMTQRRTNLRFLLAVAIAVGLVSLTLSALARSGGKKQTKEDALTEIDKRLEARKPAAGGDENAGPKKVAVSDQEYLDYQKSVRAKIVREWIIPKGEGDAAKPYVARLQVMINKNGDVISSRVVKTSGDSSYDESAMKAVREASPFPKPPDRLEWEAYNEGFLIDFDSHMKQQYDGKYYNVGHEYLNVINYPDEEYFRSLKRRFKSGWDPKAALKQDLKRSSEKPGDISAVIGIGIDAKGKLAESFFLRRSGFPKYDQEAMSVVRAGGKYPVPPNALLDEDGLLRMAWTFTVFM